MQRLDETCATDRCLAPLERMGQQQWTCSQCKVVHIGRSRPMCRSCEERHKELQIRQLPKGRALLCSKVPPNLREEHAWLDEPWPRDSRANASKIDLLEWPMLVAEGKVGIPNLVTFSGSNGAGKSTRSAHLLFLLHRQGKRPLLWVRESDLTQERDSFGPRPLFTNAVKAGALVIDELGTTRGRISDVELAFDVMLNLIDRRLMARRPTIITCHRALSKAGAKQRGQAESESLEAMAPAIYDRLKEGLVVGLPSRSHRGKWALGDTQGGKE